MMNNKKRLFAIMILVAILGVSSYATFSRYAKKVSKEGSINTTDTSYCKSKGITSLKECLIRSDSQKDLAEALNVIDDRSVDVNFNAVEPVQVFIPNRTYTDIKDKTNSTNLISTQALKQSYVVESKLYTAEDFINGEAENIVFDKETGFYTITGNIKSGVASDYVTTEDDMANGIYKYSCLTPSVNTCSELFLVTEEPYIITGYYRFKQGYKFSHKVSGTSTSKPGLYKGEDDYTIDDSTHTYYYRGEVNNNWVKFGDYLWRVIRINGNGSIRMIYAGKASDTDHTGSKGYIGATSYGDTSVYTTTTKDVTGLTNDTISLQSSNGRFTNTTGGYMYNPATVYSVYPNNELNKTNNLSKFPAFQNVQDSRSYYYFKNFNPETDCIESGENDNPGVCVLKCKSLGQDGNEGIDCINNYWTNVKSNETNYSTTAPGVYPTTNPNQYVYTSDYKYTCWHYGTPVVRENSDGTTSVYISCPVVSEIIGVYKNSTTQVRVKYHFMNSKSAEDANKNIKDSEAKKTVDSWYEKNIYGKTDSNNNQLELYLSDEYFCNDRSTNSESFPYNNLSNYNFGSTLRNPITGDKNPSFKCPNKGTDAFTLKTSGAKSTVAPQGNGNNALTYPVGLITIDEYAYAGGVRDFMNYKSYLYLGAGYLTMSPLSYDINSNLSRIFLIDKTGFMEKISTSTDYGIRPVINLKADVLYENGSGTETDPYIISINK